VVQKGTGPRRKKVGIRDLARLASVDISTVSRALNRDPRVSEARAEMIRSLAKREGYRPRPLRSNRTQAVGVLIGSARVDRIGGVGEHFLERIAWIAQQVLSERRMHVNVECVLRGVGSQRLPAIVQENRVDGVLIAGHPPVELVHRIREHGMPVVAINDTVHRLGVSCVRSEPGPALHAAILKLAAWGHRRFGLLMNDLDAPTSKARIDAYHASLADIDIEADPAWVVSDLPGEIPGGREGVRELLRRGDLPTAILCCNDWVALGALMELQSRGLRIPRDVSVVGHDDVSFCEALDPKLTSISRPEHTMVAEGVRLLLAEIEGDGMKPADELVEGAVVWRDSTGPAPERFAAQIRVADARSEGVQHAMASAV
jgi:LacI family transcriptional regulator